jgi:membrane protein implicated in regulation of membrane protease activity
MHCVGHDQNQACARSSRVGGDAVTLLWIAIALVFAVVEVLTLGLFAGFVSLGAIGAAIAAFLGDGYVSQAVTFAVVAILGVAVVRQPLLRYLQRRSGPLVLSGAAAMIGQTALVVDAIGGAHELGHVRIAGEDWPALTRDGQPVGPGESVRVVEIRRATLVVELVPVA